MQQRIVEETFVAYLMLKLAQAKQMNSFRTRGDKSPSTAKVSTQLEFFSSLAATPPPILREFSPG